MRWIPIFFQVASFFSLLTFFIVLRACSCAIASSSLLDETPSLLHQLYFISTHNFSLCLFPLFSFRLPSSLSIRLCLINYHWQWLVPCRTLQPLMFPLLWRIHLAFSSLAWFQSQFTCNRVSTYFSLLWAISRSSGITADLNWRKTQKFTKSQRGRIRRLDWWKMFLSTVGGLINDFLQLWASSLLHWWKKIITGLCWIMAIKLCHSDVRGEPGNCVAHGLCIFLGKTDPWKCSLTIHTYR